MNIKKAFLLLAPALVFVPMTALRTPHAEIASAAQACPRPTAEVQEEIDPLGLFVSIGITLDSQNGYVIATAKNAFTLFPATVEAIVMLYSSSIYQSSYHMMTMAAGNSTPDLDIGQTISAEAPIDGRRLYWQARVYYKADDADWQEKLTSVWLVEADGTMIKS